MPTYTYEPDRISENGKDRMRFELGDTDMSGQKETAALTDEEIGAILGMHRWKRAKLALVESLCRRFSYEVDTSISGLNMGLQGRVETWRIMYAELKSEIGKGSAPSVNPASIGGPHYFFGGMHDNQGGVRGDGNVSETGEPI